MTPHLIVIIVVGIIAAGWVIRGFFDWLKEREKTRQQILNQSQPMYFSAHHYTTPQPERNQEKDTE